jgi:hypothetical protein
MVKYLPKHTKLFTHAKPATPTKPTKPATFQTPQENKSGAAIKPAANTKTRSQNTDARKLTACKSTTYSPMPKAARTSRRT